MNIRQLILVPIVISALAVASAQLASAKDDPGEPGGGGSQYTTSAPTAAGKNKCKEKKGDSFHGSLSLLRRDDETAIVRNCGSRDLTGQVVYRNTKSEAMVHHENFCFPSMSETVVHHAKKGNTQGTQQPYKLGDLDGLCVAKNDPSTSTSPTKKPSPSPTPSPTKKPSPSPTLTPSPSPTPTPTSSPATPSPTTPTAFTPAPVVNAAAPPAPVNIVDEGVRGVINAVVTAVVAIGGAVAAILEALQQPLAPQPAAAVGTPAARTGPPACEGKLCAEFLTDGPQQGRLKVTFTPEQELPHGFVGLVTGPELELTGRATTHKGKGGTYTGFFDVGNGFRKDQKLCAKVFAIDEPASAKRGEQLGKEVCVVFLNDPQ